MLVKEQFEVQASPIGWSVVDADGIYVEGPFLNQPAAANRAARMNEAASRVKHIDGSNEYVVEISLVVKGLDAERVESEVIGRLNGWFCEPPTQPPFPDGSLLYWSWIEGGRAI